MGKLRTLMNKYKKGEITKAEYQAEVKKLLEGDYIEQEQYDEALEYDPEAEKPIYTQDDVDRMIVVKANKMLKKALKDGGIEIEADNKTLLPKVVELIKAGAGKDGTKATDADLAELKKLREKDTTVGTKLRDLVIENAIYKAAATGKITPVNTVQLVRALKLDYISSVDFDDETGEIDAKSLDRTLRQIETTEPYLFKEAGSDDNNDGTFKGKGPGGGTGGGTAKEKEQAETLAKAKAMLGLKTDK